jgi:hypothetical protein
MYRQVLECTMKTFRQVPSPHQPTYVLLECTLWYNNVHSETTAHHYHPPPPPLPSVLPSHQTAHVLSLGDRYSQFRNLLEGKYLHVQRSTSLCSHPWLLHRPASHSLTPTRAFERAIGSMPNITKGAIKRRHVKFVTGGLNGGGPVVQRFGPNAVSEARLKQTLATRINRLVPPAAPHSTANNHQEDDINFENFTPGDEISVQPTGEDFQGTRQPPRPRNKAAKRKSVAENWIAAEKRLVDVSLAVGKIPSCSCRAREIIFVRHISCEGRSEPRAPLLDVDAVNANRCYGV